ncbi:hypothetical protein ACRE_073710 [Hapsidospora chrysogenum ATCC 11550]|uniref:Extracellular membrane protein CFEM domain-containing protein n=1 Tax=Hapsidospora chrysogenum (strain ATCC 11550 / CBS 779.69 / DSM 880 / IAM 14645 / JCM 23072 / IMI 49137) TaxID=857340 RepID=A0A086SXU5_HAPC1|nr:hypothetical protein ACRE_073710 [Hapsidospora chrysogenum ATCC 11550]
MKAAATFLTSALCLAAPARGQSLPSHEIATGTTATTVTSGVANPIARRAETEGAECSPEGQWNCMPDTWQRCASGRWSVVMDLAEGTICTPQGLVDDITVEHDGSVNGGDGGSSGGGDDFSMGSRRSIVAYTVLAIGVVACVQLGWY